MKKNGCLYKGCLTTLVGFGVLLLVLFFAFRVSRDFPDRFVLSVRLEGKLDECGSPTSGMPFGTEELLSFQDLLFLFDHATRDKRIDTVLLEIGNLEAPPSKIAELRQAVEKLRAGGRNVIAWLRSAEDSDYLLASACDSVIVERGGALRLDGLKAESFYFTRPLGKVGISVQAAQWRRYKSGIEPFTRTEGSAAFREQSNAILDEVYSDYIGYVSKRRGVGADSLESIINNVALVHAGDAVRLGLADGVASLWELKRALSRKIAGKPLEEAGDLFVSGETYRAALKWPVEATTNEAVAVLTLAGPIVESSGRSPLGGEGVVDVEMVRTSLDLAMRDSDVKAIVLRIDSPGGEALAAANMLQMLDSAAARKPLVVSMSGVAASGGYMAALAGREIYAMPLTLTGSIGVYALRPDLSGLISKTGLGRDVITRGRFADAETPFKPFDKEEYKRFVDASGVTYLDFIEKVAASRKMSVAAADSVAGGRVWTGRQAIRQGLVDHAGGLFDAIRAAQKLARIDMKKQPRVVLYPEKKSWLQLLFEGNLAAIPEYLKSIVVRAVLREVPPSVSYSALFSMYEAMLLSGEVHLVAAMPCDIIIR